MNNTSNTYAQDNTKQKTAGARFLGSLGAGFAGLFVLPVLGVLGVSFAAIGAGLPVLSILNLVGLTYVPFNVLLWQIVGFPQVLVALLVGAVFLALGWLCFLGLKKFLAFSRRVSR